MASRKVHKRQQGMKPIVSTVAKKRCLNRSPLNDTDLDGKLHVNDPQKELGIPKEIKIEGITRGLTTTPVGSNTTSTPCTSGNNKKSTESLSTNNLHKVECPSCGQCFMHQFPTDVMGQKQVRYTLSSDEEEPVSMPYNSVQSSMPASQLYRMESEGSKSDCSSASEILQDEFDNSQYSSVTDINRQIGMEDDKELVHSNCEEGMDFNGEDLEQEEHVSDEEQEVQRKRTDYPLRCRSIRIGSYKVDPNRSSTYVPVHLSENSITFQAPVPKSSKTVSIQLKLNDIQQAVVHFGRCLPIMFVFTSPSFGKSVRKSLHMVSKKHGLHMVSKKHVYFDPTSQDDRMKKLTFLIEVMTEAQKNFIRHVFPGEKKVKEVNQKMANEILVRSTPSQKYDDPQYSSVTDINPRIGMEADKELAHSDCEEGMNFNGKNLEQEVQGKTTHYPLYCHSIRIGSYMVHLSGLPPYEPVLSKNSITFQAPVVSKPSKTVSIQLKLNDIQQAVVHFGRCLPIMFVFTSPSFGERVRKCLHMVSKKCVYFDPTSQDDRINKLTFLIERINKAQKNFIRHVFPGEKMVKEVDKKMVNEILVGRSTPSQLSVTKNIAPHQPVIKLLTYPPSPQTGGIAITFEDLACLKEGEFLNDAIIDFYLKYIFFEKLSPYQQEKAHIFSSSFYSSLTHKPDRLRPGDGVGKTMKVRRHNQVKTWTRHVDIFSKDFIIIPVKQLFHWFLAIICYPSRVPEASSISMPESKSSDNVTSTDEQDNTNKIIIKEISSNGDGNSPNQYDNSTSMNSPYEVEEPLSSESSDSSTHPDGQQRKEMPCICIFDSMCGPNRWRIAATLREYLEIEWKSKKGSKKVFNRNTMQGFIMKCPQQTNYKDCGMYLLQYVESFFENPIPYFGTPMPDLTNWFSEAKISKKRLQLQELIFELQKKQKVLLQTLEK